MPGGGARPVKDLYRCLADHPVPLRQAIARTWATGLTPGDDLADVRALADALLASPRAGEVVSALSAGAREALAVLAREGGALPAHRLRGHGSIRRFGPARLAREQPWRSPANPLEELLYAGLIYRAYGSAEAQLGEILLIPEELLTLLEPIVGAPAPAVLAPLEDVPQQAAQGDALAEDVLAILVHLRAAPAAGLDPESDPLAPSYPPGALDLGERLRGPRDPERLALIRQILWRLRLVRAHRQAVQPALRARDWLRLDGLRRQRALLVAWRDDPHWNELWHLPGIRIDLGERPAPPLPRARRLVLEALARSPREGWVPLEALAALLKRQRPDYVRADGDWDSLFAQRATSGEYLTGFAAWDEIEGALAAHLVTRSLYWLGVVELGLSAEGAPLAYRVSSAGWRLLADATGGADGTDAAGEAPDEPSPDPATVEVLDEGLAVTIPVAGTMYDRYQLERFAEWRSQDGAALYHVTPESVWYSQSAEITIAQIERFLQRISGGKLPTAAQAMLQAWGGRYGRAFLSRVALLETVDEETMGQIRAEPRLRPLLGNSVSRRACLVAEEHVEELLALLREQGIWAHVRGAG